MLVSIGMRRYGGWNGWKKCGKNLTSRRRRTQRTCDLNTECGSDGSVKLEHVFSRLFAGHGCIPCKLRSEVQHMNHVTLTCSPEVSLVLFDSNLV